MLIFRPYFCCSSTAFYIQSNSSHLVQHVCTPMSNGEWLSAIYYCCLSQARPSVYRCMYSGQRLIWLPSSVWHSVRRRCPPASRHLLIHTLPPASFYPTTLPAWVAAYYITVSVSFVTLLVKLMPVAEIYQGGTTFLCFSHHARNFPFSFLCLPIFLPHWKTHIWSCLLINYSLCA